MTEYVSPDMDKVARVVWSAEVDGAEPSQQLRVHHAWLFENLSENRVRLLTQETQMGEPAKKTGSRTAKPYVKCPSGLAGRSY
ncbi:SRPBCC family protein [Entomobacter blattae]|uniref:Uncharacterized protein n=1 Tax=Entomobacter blattae TaxID=2762277 RepID=A0A7H1NRC4_9PROT|nr:hypothetical protein [Entomobacter blattae]QNT78334.1 hypothetical protein JGUZn3_11070 [Entomobacter blattae]